MQWAIVVRVINGLIEDNFEKIQAMMNLLIGLVTIAVGLLMGLVLGLLIGVIRMACKVRVLRQGIYLMKTRAIEGLSLRKGSKSFYDRSEAVSGVSDL